MWLMVLFTDQREKEREREKLIGTQGSGEGVLEREEGNEKDRDRINRKNVRD